MITEQDLFDLGFERKEDLYNEIWYKRKFIFPYKFGVKAISGEFTKSKSFRLYEHGTEYIHKENLEQVVNVFK